jgi:hypothetical protein
MSNISGYYDYEQSVGRDMDMSYIKTLSQKKYTEINKVRIQSLMVSTPTTGMQNAVIVMQQLRKYDWCKS